MCVCQYSDYDAFKSFKHLVKLGANKLETKAGKLFASFSPKRL